MHGMDGIYLELTLTEVHMKLELGPAVNYCVQLEQMDDFFEYHMTDKYIGADGRVHEPFETDEVPEQCRFNHLANAMAAYMTYSDDIGNGGRAIYSAIGSDGTRIPVPDKF